MTSPGQSSAGTLGRRFVHPPVSFWLEVSRQTQPSQQNDYLKHHSAFPCRQSVWRHKKPKHPTDRIQTKQPIWVGHHHGAAKCRPLNAAVDCSLQPERNKLNWINNQGADLKVRGRREKRYHNPLGGKLRRNNISPALAPRVAGI